MSVFHHGGAPSWANGHRVAFDGGTVWLSMTSRRGISYEGARDDLGANRAGHAARRYIRKLRRRRRMARKKAPGMGMSCETIDLGEGQRAIICTGRGQRTKPKTCVACPAPATELCDALKKGVEPGTEPTARTSCSAPLCARCATVVGDDRHLCPGHAGVECEHGLVPFHACDVPCGWCKSPCGRHRPGWPQCPGVEAAAS